MHVVRAAASLAVLATAGCGTRAPAASYVTDWTDVLVTTLAGAELGPVEPARVATYASIALYEGFAADPGSGLASLAGQLNGLWSVPVAAEDAPVDGATVAAVAARIVVDSLLGAGVPEARRRVDSLARAHVERRRKDRVRSERRDRSVAHGEALAAALVQWISGDGLAAARERQRRTPARANSGATSVESAWGTLRTFVLRTAAECPQPPMPAYSTRPASDYWKFAKELRDTARAATAAHRDRSAYWLTTSGAGAWYRWIEAAGRLGAGRAGADSAVEVLLLTAIAIGDANAAAWRNKYRSSVPSPATGVRRLIDAGFRGAMEPAFPPYPGDGVLVAAATGSMLAGLLGDSTLFPDTVRGGPGGRLTLMEAADEVAHAYGYAGILPVSLAQRGVEPGQCVGERVLGRLRTRGG